MKQISARVLSLSFFAVALSLAAEAQPPTITITRAGSQPSQQGPAERFTGSVRVDPLFGMNEPSGTSGAYVTFEPRARTAWHSHPAGQTLIVTAGTGRVQSWGTPAEEIRVGDVVRIPPGVKHWHGASAGAAMTHIALTAAVNGKNADWMEHVSDEQYNAGAATSTPATAQLQITQPNVAGRRMSPQDVQTVAPAFEKYTQERLYGEVWKRPGLSQRDRSLVTIAAMLARGEAPALSYYFDQALENGVRPREISETITHLAFYTGWGRSFAAIAPAKDLFARRGIGADQLPPATVTLLPLNEQAEAQRASNVSQQFGAVSPGVVQYTNDVLFRELWRRPDLAPRDRSLITVSALVATGQVAQIPYHLNRAMDNGLTQAEAGEALTHLAFYAGWPPVFSALPVAKEVFEGRAKQPASGQSSAAISPPSPQKNGMVVRISEIQIDPQHLDEYNALLQEEAEASVRLEPGVISIFPMYQQQDPTEVRILEIYANLEAYRTHIASPHFQKYKTTTLRMVKSLKLIDMESIDPATMTQIFAKLKTR